MSERQPYQFPATQWSEIEHARRDDTVGSDALGRLLLRYMTPLRAHLVRERHIPDQQTDDLLQGFVADKVLHRDLLSSAVKDKGRFRTFLITALDRYVSTQLRDANRQKRSTKGHLALDEAPASADPGPTPSGVFELAWARQVLANAAARTKAECDASNRPDLWAVFEGRVLLPTLEGAEPVPYENLLQSHNLTSLEAASNLLVTGKRMFARSLRGVVEEYMGAGGEIEREIADLRAILARGRD